MYRFLVLSILTLFISFADAQAIENTCDMQFNGPLDAFCSEGVAMQGVVTSGCEDRLSELCSEHSSTITSESQSSESQCVVESGKIERLKKSIKRMRKKLRAAIKSRS